MTGEDEGGEVEKDTMEMEEDIETWSLLVDGLDAGPPPAAGTRERLLEALRGAERFAPFVGEVATTFGLTEAEVREAFACMRDPGAWRPSFLPGSESLTTPALGRAHAVISRVPAGTHIAKHGHVRRELTYVLDGELVEDGARRAGPGELLAPEIGSEHEVSVGGADDCLVVFAIVDPAR